MEKKKVIVIIEPQKEEAKDIKEILTEIIDRNIGMGLSKNN